MAHRSVPAPSCPLGHINSQIHARGTKSTKRGTTRWFRCHYIDDEDGESHHHHFTGLCEPAVLDPNTKARHLLDAAIPVPPCPDTTHQGRVVYHHGTYKTADGTRQRYQCRVRGTKSKEGLHTFSSVKRRHLVRVLIPQVCRSHH